MRLLLLDTSSKYLSLAIAQEKKILTQTHRPFDRKHSTRLVSLIKKLLKKTGLSLSDIDGFCVGKGPGSFTGLRIGVATIKGLSYVLQKPVVAIPSLDILAENAKKNCLNEEKGQTIQICPIVDAKQNKVYACLYKVRNGKIKRKSGYQLLPFEILLKTLKGKVVFLGDALKLYRERITKSKEIEPVFIDEKLWYPRISAVVSLALERFRKKDTKDAKRLVPLYLYPKECQIKKIRQK